MRKIALITDTHSGIRGDAGSVLDNQKLFYDQVFFPHLQNNGIHKVIHLGDIVDRRKYINFLTLTRLRTDFLNTLEWDFDPTYIAGNHDVYFKDNNDLSFYSATGLCRDYIWHRPETRNIHGEDILMVPWITRYNLGDCLDAIQKSNARICIGHFELQGFEMHAGAFCDHGMDPKLLDKFELVLSGHFHKKSTYGNINYLGCPFPMNWGDYGDEKGFHVLDLDTRKLEFIPNPYSLFHKIEYDDKTVSLTEMLDSDFEKYRKSYIRVVVKNKTNPVQFDSFMEKLEDVEPIAVQVIEDKGFLIFEGDAEELLHVEDTIKMLSSYCDNVGVADTMKPALHELFQDIYTEASNVRLA